MLHRMKRIRVVGPKKDLQQVVNVLYRTGTVHLEDVSQCVPVDQIQLNKVEAAKQAEVLGLLAKIGGIVVTLPVKSDPAKRKEIDAQLGAMSYDQIIERANQVIGELEWTARELATRKSDQEFTIIAMNRYEKVIEKIRHIENELPVLENYEVNILIIQKEFSGVLDLIRDELQKITHDQFEFAFTDVDESSIASIAIFNKRYSEQVHAFIFSTNVNEVRLPKEFMGMRFNDMLVLIEEKRLKATQEISQINKDLEKMSVEWYLELSSLKAYLEDISEELNLFNKFAESGYTCMIMGWVPGKYLKRTKKALNDAFGDRVVLEDIKVTATDLKTAPTFYDNPWFVKPFEFLMGLVMPPKYTEVDPSPILAIFFPLFFGLMVGDIGYGLVILAISLVVRKKFEKVGWLKDLSSILLVSSIPTIIFGILFGEFFGDLGEIMGWLHPMTIQGVHLNRIEAIIPMLMISIVVGIIHVFLGLGIGLVNAITLKSAKHALEKIGMLSALSGIIVIAGCIIGAVPEVLLYPGLFLLVISLPAILYGGGIFGTIELVSAVGNIMSYARLMAIGMASVILALVANQFVGTLEIVILGVLVALLLHAMNLILAMFSPSIHALRLHMVEFFSKFYEGGGVAYKPFKRQVEPP